MVVAENHLLQGREKNTREHGTLRITFIGHEIGTKIQRRLQYGHHGTVSLGSAQPNSAAHLPATNSK